MNDDTVRALGDTGRRRLLLLSYAFPPATAPEAMLAAKRAGNLAGWDVEVIAAAPFHPGMGNDAEMAAYAQARFTGIHRLRPPVRLPLHRFGALAHLPDTMRILNRQAVAKATALHAANPFDAMLSWSTYHSVHLVARRLKARFGLPWLAHMSDPWVDNPFVSYGGLTGAINRALERAVIGECDRVLFTTPETVELVMDKYPAEWRARAVVIPHGYDPSLYAGAGPEPLEDRALAVRYLGNFYGIRSPEPLFAALREIVRREPRALDGVVFEIVGKLDPGMMETAQAFALPEGLVRLRAPVGYRESLALMETADLLLIVDAPAERSVFLPSKLVDYLGARRPILSLTPEGASRRVTLAAGFWAAKPEDAGACADALMKALDAVRSGAIASGNHAAYSVEATGRALADVLESVVVGRAAPGGQRVG